MIIAAKPAVAITRARHRSILSIVVKHLNGTEASRRKLVRLTAWARKDLTWWLNLNTEERHMSPRKVPVWDSVRIATDASWTLLQPEERFPSKKGWLSRR